MDPAPRRKSSRPAKSGSKQPRVNLGINNFLSVSSERNFWTIPRRLACCALTRAGRTCSLLETGSAPSTSMQLTINELERSQIEDERTRLVVPEVWLFFLAFSLLQDWSVRLFATEAYEAAASSFCSTNASTPLA